VQCTLPEGTGVDRSVILIQKNGARLFFLVTASLTFSCVAPLRIVLSLRLLASRRLFGLSGPTGSWFAADDLIC
jgi:hypothetical protein